MKSEGNSTDAVVLQSRLDRERRARAEAEALAEWQLRALYEKQTQIHLLQGIAAAANFAKSVEEAMQETLHLICAYTHWPVGHVYLVDANHDELKPSKIWHIDEPTGRYESYRKATEELRLKPGIGLPGRVLTTRQAVCISRLAEDDNFLRQKVALECQLISGFAFPVALGNDVAAVLEFFSATPISLEEPFYEVAADVAEKLARVIERQQAERALREAHWQLERRVRERTIELAQTVEELNRKIVEQRRTEQALLVRDRAIAATNNGIIICDAQQPDLPMIYCNPAFEKMTGYTPDEVLGRNCRFLQGPASDPETVNMIRGALRQRESCQVVIKNYRKDGEPFWNELSISPVFDPAGRLTHYVGIHTDITNRRQAEEAELRKKDKEARFNRAMMGLAQLDKSNISLALRTLLKTLAQTMEVSRVSLWLLVDDQRTLENTLHYQLATDDFDENSLRLAVVNFSAFFAALAQGGAIQADEARKDPRTSEFLAEYLQPLNITSLIAVPVWTHGKLVGTLTCEHTGRVRTWQSLDREAVISVSEMIALAFESDIRRRTEEALRKTQAELLKSKEATDAANVELARAARLKDEFLASMSHELRTPLNAILGLSEALQEQVFGALNAKQLKSLLTIEESGRHLLALINDILDLSKIEAGKVQLDLQMVDIESVCQGSLRFIKEIAQKKNLKICYSFHSPAPTVRADERRLKQILINLLSNAVKFTPEGGSVTLEVAPGAEAATVSFAIIDTGIGISPENLTRLFQSFVQIDSRLSREFSGTGLGLALVKRMTEMHGGRVTVTSELGKGSRFYVQLPLGHPVSETVASQQVLALPETDQPLTTSPTTRVLIVEDSEAAAQQLTRYLGELGLEATTHEIGTGAINKAAELQAVLVVLDIKLPDYSGWDLATQFKADPRTKNIPILIVSIVDDRARGLALGAAEYLVKPVTRQQLVDTLQKIGIVNQTTTETPITPPVSSDLPLILLAEDNPANVGTFVDYLTIKGFKLLTASDGEEAVAMAKQHRPDLILMDVQMPKLDCMEAIKLIRADAAIAATPIIALTAMAMSGDREKCLAAGANDYLSKPVNLKKLAATITALLAERSAAPPAP